MKIAILERKRAEMSECEKCSGLGKVMIGVRNPKYLDCPDCKNSKEYTVGEYYTLDQLINALELLRGKLGGDTQVRCEGQVIDGIGYQFNVVQIHAPR